MLHQVSMFTPVVCD